MAKRSRAVVPLADQSGRVRRPSAVTLVAWIFILQGSLYLLSGLLKAWRMREPILGLLLTQLSFADLQEITLEILIGLGLLAAAYGLLRLGRWAWTIAMATQCLILTASLMDRLAGKAPYDIMFLGVLSVLILNQRDVRLIFESPQGEGA